MSEINVKRKLSPTQITFIKNSLIKLGFNYSYKGTSYLIKLISLAYSLDVYTINTEILYLTLNKSLSNISYEGIRSSIKYSFRNINIKKAQVSFENIFGYSYSQDIFTPKTFIEEFIFILDNSNQ